MLKKIIAVALALATVIVLVFCISNIHEKKVIRDQWYDARFTTTITVKPNKTLWSIAEEYKPSWMDTREYIHEIKALNNMTTSSIDIGQLLVIYTTNTTHHLSVTGGSEQ